MDVSVSGTIKESICKNLEGASAPLALPGSAYAESLAH